MTIVATPIVKPRIIRSALNAYTDGYRAVATMPSLAVIAILISVAYGIVDFAFDLAAGAKVDPISGFELLKFVTSLAWNFLITPFCIAVHRFIILGEVTPRYVIAPRQPRFWYFFGWTVLLSLIYLPIFLIPASWSRSAPVLALISVTIVLVCAFVAVFLTLCLTILFPAIAVDAPGASWQSALADTKGNMWRMFFIFLVAMLPPLAIGLLVALALWPDRFADEGAPFIGNNLDWSLLALVSAILAVAIASRLYQALGDRLKQPLSS